MSPEVGSVVSRPSESIHGQQGSSLGGPGVLESDAGTVTTGAVGHLDDGGPARVGLEQRFADEALPLSGELTRIARRYTVDVHDAEDLVQETLVKAWVGFASCAPGSNLRAWMVRIMVNIWIDNHRKSQRRPQEVLTGSVTDSPVAIERQRRSVVPSAEETALNSLPNEPLRQSIRSLPAVLQTAVFYAEVCQFPVRIISEIERVPMGTVMSRLHRARRQLRSALLEQGAPEKESPRRRR